MMLINIQLVFIHMDFYVLLKALYIMDVNTIIQKNRFKIYYIINQPFIIQTIIFVFSRKKQSENYEKMTNSLDITINNTLESIKGVRVIRAYNMKKLIGKKFYENVQKYSDNFLNYILKYAIISPITLISQALSYSILIIYG